MRELVTVVIPNYNGEKFLDRCLHSLARQTFRAFRILVIDNGSEDRSREVLERLREAMPIPMEVIYLDHNTGFSGAVNRGIRESRTPYVILLNNDVECDEFYIAELVRAIAKSPKIFSVSPKMIQMYHPDLMDDAGDMYSVMGWAYQRGVGQSIRRYCRAVRIFSSCAGAAIYRRRVFDEIGLFDEMHFAYLEDIDVGYRSRIYGYDNLYCPRAKVWHVGSGTSGSKYNPFKVRLAARNNLYLIWKNMPVPQILLNLPALAAGTFVKYLFFARMNYGKEYAEGCLEGLRTAGKAKRVPYKPEHLQNYLIIEGELIFGAFLYGYELLRRKVKHG